MARDVLWSPDDGRGVGPAEVASMAREGLITPLLGPVFVTAGVPVTREIRAEGVRMVTSAGVNTTGVLHRDAAAWFHSCAPAPEMLWFMVHRRHRTTMRPSPVGAAIPWCVRQLVYPPQDVDRFHDIQVTTPLRTAADLACWDHPAAETPLRLLLSAPHLAVDPGAVVAVLRNLPRLPGRARGVMRVRRVCRALGLDVPD